MPSKIRSNNAEYSEPVGDMGYNVELKRSLKHHQTSRIVKEKILSPRASRSLKLQDKLKLEKSVGQSHTDLHHETLQNVDDRPLVPHKSSGNHQKQWVGGKATEDDELIKYMSNLPGFLQRVEREENLQEKALNFGVLDWGRLEKWKDNHKRVPGRSSLYAPPTSNTSPLFSTVGSSSLSSRGRSGFPAHQKKESVSLRSHLNSSPKEDHSLGFNPSCVNFVDLHDLKTASKNISAGQQKLSKTDASFGRNYSEIKLGKGKRKDSRPNIVPEVETSSSNLEICEVPFNSEGKMKAQDGESKRRMEQLQEFDFNLADQHCPSRHKTIILLVPRDCPQSNCPEISQLSQSTKLDDGRTIEANCKSFSDRFYLEEEAHFSEVYSGIPHSCPLPCSVESSLQLDMKLPNSINAQDTKTPSDASHSVPCSTETPRSRSKGNHAEQNKSTIKPANTTVIETFDRLDLKTAEGAATKSRNPSPNRRFSIGMGRMSRSFSVKESSALPQLTSTYIAAKSGPVRSTDFHWLDDLYRDKANANGRARSSPLRRLLDPLLKPKAANYLHSAEPSRKESTSMLRACKLSDSSTVQLVKRNLNFSGCRPTNADDSPQEEKHEVSTGKAFLQVTVNNGFPLFTFEVDNCSDFLAATMRKISTSEKYDYSRIYAFHSFREIKKKSGGWINQGSKGKSQGYVCNVVGQMKVSDSHCPKLTEHSSKDQFMVREFVLSDMELRQADQGTPEFQPKSELAAIVVKVPKGISGSLSNDGQQSDNCKVLSEMGTECLPKERCSCKSGENLQSGSTTGSENVFSAIAILPSGFHGLPSTGVPSPLIDRWKSGGSCDCGGWDVGCKLRILADQDLYSKTSGLRNSCPKPDQFDLFVQGGTQESKPVLSLAPIEKGIYTVNFNASISSLQAFSICIAAINSWKPSDHLEVTNLSEAKTSQESISMENDRIRAPSRVEGSPARYVPYPPLSPVGRI
ncbi:hypothetical protein HHK36_018491 [Tetracentron sinense]|uniref:Uncharacterized protein n=1 Tax=Tetracentron sinense TaxID=13715 RepID=A0A835DBB8_TETSI|nr:hypothetical protein HHK36_018491 [Tetracentron sinense]